MDKYNVYWKEIKIGTLSVEGKKHKYVPEKEAIGALKNPLDPRLKEERDWGEAIPFFETRLKSAARFPNLEIGNHTDFYTLKKIEGEP